jgi:hypothetical protein
VVAVSAIPAARPHPAGDHAGAAAATPGEIKHAILTAFNGVGGDVFYAKISETYPGQMSKWNGVSQSWAYPLQPQAGNRAYVRYLTVPGGPGEKTDAELIYTATGGGQSGAPLTPTKTEVIDVLYGSRTWSVTTAAVAVESETGNLQALRESIAKGQFTVVGTVVLNGQTVLELTARSEDAGVVSVQTWWVDPATYLPVRSLSINGGVRIQVDYEFLPPTPANIAEVTVTIPPGFTRTATIDTRP